MYFEEYFHALHQYVEREKNALFREILQVRKHLEDARQQANSFYLHLLEEIKDIGDNSHKVAAERVGEVAEYLRNLRKRKFDIAWDALKWTPRLRDVHQVGAELGGLLREGRWGGEAGLDLKLKCEGENSSIRSLQLSFEEENNFTLNQEPPGAESGVSSNLLLSERF